MPTQQHLSAQPELRGLRKAIAALKWETPREGNIGEQAFTAVLEYAAISSRESLFEAIRLVVRLGDTIYLPRERVSGAPNYKVPASGCEVHTRVRALLRNLALIEEGHTEELVSNGLGAELAWTPNGGGALWLFDEDDADKTYESRLGTVYKDGVRYRASTKQTTEYPSFHETLLAAQQYVEHKVGVERASEALRVRHLMRELGAK